MVSFCALLLLVLVCLSFPGGGFSGRPEEFGSTKGRSYGTNTTSFKHRRGEFSTRVLLSPFKLN